METIVFKAPNGTKARLKQLGNISEVLRQQTELLLRRTSPDSALAKCRDLAGAVRLGKNASTTKDYLKGYGQKKHR